MRTAILYAYYEKNDMYKENLRYFLDNGLIESVDAYIISNGPVSVQIPEGVTLLCRENRGADFAAWNHGLKYLSQNNKTYDYYFFINTSIRGPFLPKYYTGTWLDAYLQLFTYMDDSKGAIRPEIHLVGCTICNLSTKSEYNPIIQEIVRARGLNRHPPFTHVQSMFFGITKRALDHVYLKGLFDYSGATIADTVFNQEITLSQMILDNGWNINCMLNAYRDINWLDIRTDCEVIGAHSGGDLWWNNAYFGKNIHPYEVIFFKNNRIPLLEYETFSQARFLLCYRGDNMISAPHEAWKSITKKYIPHFDYIVDLPSAMADPHWYENEKNLLYGVKYVCQLPHDFFFKYNLQALIDGLNSNNQTVIFNKPKEGIIEQGEKDYPGFTAMWAEILEILDLTNWTLAKIPYFPNMWILSRDRYLTYSAFVSRAYKKTQAFTSSSDKKHLINAVFDRLPCLFFSINRWI